MAYQPVTTRTPTSAVSAGSSRWHYPVTQTPEDTFYKTFQAAYVQNAATLKTAETDALAAPLQAVLGKEHVDRSGNAGIGNDKQARFAAVLNKAYAGDAMADPQKFLLSLSVQEMEALRINHGLADSIHVGGLSNEGASNLLLPRGYSLDLNNDGLEEVGAARTMSFPPRDAPAEFVTKWREITADMDPGDEMMYAFEMHHALYGFHLDGQTAREPAATDLMATYRSAIQNLLENVEVSKPYNTQAWYDRSMAFYTNLKVLMA
jgi:hypothetical protein